MKNSTNAGFAQHYNGQTVVDLVSRLVVATALSNHLNDKRKTEPALAAIPTELGMPPAAALDNGDWSPVTLQALDRRGIDAQVATGREPHHTIVGPSPGTPARRRESES